MYYGNSCRVLIRHKTTFMIITFVIHNSKTWKHAPDMFASWQLCVLWGHSKPDRLETMWDWGSVMPLIQRYRQANLNPAETNVPVVNCLCFSLFQGNGCFPLQTTQSYLDNLRIFVDYEALALIATNERFNFSTAFQKVKKLNVSDLIMVA